MNNLKKIAEGQTGSEVATLIYENDNKLYDLYQSCRNELEANKAYVAMINSGDNKTLISVVSTTGTSQTDVMSQSAVTSAIDSVSTGLSNVCVMSDYDIEEIGTESEVTSAKTQELLEKIASLEERISKLENPT
jgi:hypothetical protein